MISLAGHTSQMQKHTKGLEVIESTAKHRSCLDNPVVNDCESTVDKLD